MGGGEVYGGLECAEKVLFQYTWEFGTSVEA